MLDYIFNSGLYPESWVAPILAAVIMGVWHFLRIQKERRSRDQGDDKA